MRCTISQGQHEEFEDTKSVNGRRTQWQKEKVQKNKQRSTKHPHKTKDRVTRTPLYARVLSGHVYYVC
jgi:hypothetical protein